MTQKTKAFVWIIALGLLALAVFMFNKHEPTYCVGNKCYYIEHKCGNSHAHVEPKPCTEGLCWVFVTTCDYYYYDTTVTTK